MQTTSPSKNIKLLLVEDNLALAEEVIFMLNDSDGYAVSHSPTLMNMFQKLDAHPFDIIVLDRFLPDGDSLHALQSIKQQHLGFIVMLTAANESKDRIHSLNSGVDYYLAKPIHLDELTAVLNTFMRRHTITPSEWQLNASKASLISPNGQEITLTAREVQIVQTLLNQKDTAITKDDLLQIIKAYTTKASPTDEYDIKRLETTMYRIRKKIQDVYLGHNPIINVYGVGYMWRIQADKTDD